MTNKLGVLVIVFVMNVFPLLSVLEASLDSANSKIDLADICISDSLSAEQHRVMSIYVGRTT